MSGTSHVLARKYRPMAFADLIGQEVLVQTVTNAIAANRLPNAYMLTGIRGIGKTTSARIIAKGLNCVGPDGQGGMTPNPCGKCRHCLDISADAHMDVIEIDAASNTGVDNVREIIDGARYNPVSARFKVYIIDEVHMLSKPAFNALLKTLEEPPERVKFIFATTEIRKVPVTILSRCQRFDLKRVSEEDLTKLMMRICQEERRDAEEGALRLIARAGDGSVRDSLSLLDQAMTQEDGLIVTESVRHMLGGTDKELLFDLFGALMQGQARVALELLSAQYEAGADPVLIAQDLLNLTHQITRLKLIPELLNDLSLSPIERTRGKEFSEKLSMPTLSGVWQMMLKGVGEVKTADDPLKALEMLLIRLVYLSEMPSLPQLIRDVKKKSELRQSLSQKQDEENTHPLNVISESKEKTTPVASESTDIVEKCDPCQSKDSEQFINQELFFHEIKDISDFARSKQERILAFNIDSYIRPVDIQNGLIVCGLAEETPRQFTTDLVRFLNANTPFKWQVKQHQNVHSKTRKEDLADRKKQLHDALRQNPVVAEVLNAFPKAKIERVKERPPVREESENTPESINKEFL